MHGRRTAHRPVAAGTIRHRNAEDIELSITVLKRPERGFLAYRYEEELPTRQLLQIGSGGVEVVDSQCCLVGAVEPHGNTTTECNRQPTTPTRSVYRTACIRCN